MKSLTLWAIAAIALVLPIVVGCSRVEGGGGSITGAAVVPWDKAGEHDGVTVTVEGPVVDVHYAPRTHRQPTFIDVGQRYPDPTRLTALIWGDDLAKFTPSPQELYGDKTIRVTGKVRLYKGSAEIIVTDPGSIEVVK